MKLFEPITVSLDDLLLDPNNPRLVRKPHEGTLVPDKLIEQQQQEILERFDRDGGSGLIDISDLYDSMRRLGYVGIDQMVVRELVGSTKYVVVEGNRRVSTLKKLVQEYQEGRLGTLTEEILTSFSKLRVMKLLTENLPESEIQRRLSVILGLRHHGSLLEWEPLPKAHNIYIHYMNLQASKTDFEWEPESAREVASMLSVKYNVVRQSLRTYIAYLQLSKRTKVRSDYYSLIQAAVTNRNLTSYDYINIHKSSFRLTSDSVERMMKICQFNKRHNLTTEQKIIPRPQVFSQLGRIVERAHRAKQLTVRTLAAALLEEIESEELDDKQELKTTVEDAWVELRAFEARLQWVVSLNELLRRQKEELPFDAYLGEGNDKLEKDNLMKLLTRFRAILDLP